MPYPEEMIAPMRAELTEIGVEETRTAEDVDAAIGDSGTAFFVINSVCGCAAGGARPAVRLALESDVKPERIATAFAGNDVEGVARIRERVGDIPPSSPSFALFKDGELVEFVPRHMIEGSDPVSLANSLSEAFKKHCGAPSA